jgi:uncharacterized protein YyaL (SSP411 family)
MHKSDNKQATALFKRSHPIYYSMRITWWRGEEAFEKAKNEDKPIFLSLGYSTCHWCHVMVKNWGFLSQNPFFYGKILIE